MDNEVESILGKLDVFFSEHSVLITLINFAVLITAALIQRVRDKTIRNNRKAIRNIITGKLRETGREPVFF